MNIPCTNWEDAGIPGAGRCKLSLYDGLPSNGVCVQICKRYDGPKVQLPPPLPAVKIELCDDSPKQPGSLVKLILSKLGYSSNANCGCEAMCKKMNAWSWRGCYRHRKQIVDWFIAKAREQNIAVDGAGIWSLLRAGLRDVAARALRRSALPDGQ
jgi:hypothetical protein